MLLMPPLIADSCAFLLLIMPLIGDSVVFLLLLYPLNADSVPFLLPMPPYFPCIFIAFYCIFVTRKPYAAYAAFHCRFLCIFASYNASDWRFRSLLAAYAALFSLHFLCILLYLLDSEALCCLYCLALPIPLLFHFS